MGFVDQILALTPYEAKRRVTGRVLRHFIDVQMHVERQGPPKLNQILNLRIEGEAHPFQIELARFPEAAWTAAGDTVAFDWQERNRKAFGFQRLSDRGHDAAA